MSDKGIEKIEERELLDTYGLMYLLAYGDGKLDKNELGYIFEHINVENISEKGKNELYDYLINPPNFYEILKRIRVSSKEIKYLAYSEAMGVAYSNDNITPDQEKIFEYLKRELGVNEEQDKAIREYILKMKEIQKRGIDDDYAREAVKTAVSGLGAVGVPIAAVWFSGITGISAAGITTGLSALALGFGMIPGIGTAILIGVGVFGLISKLFDNNKKVKEEELKKEREKRKKEIIENIKLNANNLIAKIENLEEQSLDPENKRKLLKILLERSRLLNQVIADFSL